MCESENKTESNNLKSIDEIYRKHWNACMGERAIKLCMKEYASQFNSEKAEGKLSKEKVLEILSNCLYGITASGIGGINTAAEQICSLEGKNEWISANTHPEKDHAEVLLLMKTGEIISATYCDDVDTQYRSNLWEDWMEITHWMPLPEAPTTTK